jgi:3-oxoacyl-[acyl-carrier-protein] synthase III
MKNPHVKSADELKVSPATYQAATDAVVNYCKAHPDKAELDDDDVRATHPALANLRVFNQIKKEVGG